MERRIKRLSMAEDMEGTSMPISILISYRTYEKRLREGDFELGEIPCFR